MQKESFVSAINTNYNTREDPLKNNYNTNDNEESMLDHSQIYMQKGTEYQDNNINNNYRPNTTEFKTVIKNKNQSNSIVKDTFKLKQLISSIKNSSSI